MIENLKKETHLGSDEKFKQVCKYAYENGFVDEYTHTTLKSISMGFKVEMVIGKRYSPNGLRVLAEIKEIFPNLLTIHANSIKTYDTTVQVGRNLLFGNRGDPYTFDVANGIENCNDDLLSYFKKRFNEEKKLNKELKTKEEILFVANLFEEIQNANKLHKLKKSELEM